MNTIATFTLMAANAASLCAVPKDVFFRLIEKESNWQHWESKGKVLESVNGAVGIAQVKPSSAFAGLNVYDPFDNLLAGACLLHSYKGKGSWEDAVRSYNAGPWRKKTTEATKSYAGKIAGGK